MRFLPCRVALRICAMMRFVLGRVASRVCAMTRFVNSPDGTVVEKVRQCVFRIRCMAFSVYVR